MTLLEGKVEYFKQPVPPMAEFEAAQKQIQNDYYKQLAKIGAGAALEIGATALIPAGMGLGAKVGTQILKPFVGKAIGRAIGQGVVSGGLSGGLSGIGHGLMTNRNPVVTGIVGGVGGVLGGALGGGALGTLGGYTTKLNNARKLIYHKPFEDMNKVEKNLYGKLGKNYYKDYIQSRPVNNPILGKINFSGEQASKPNYKFMEQYPALRGNLKNAGDNVWVGKNKKRTDAFGFNNMKVNFKNKDYDYQIRQNANDFENYFYNIKPYEFFEQDLNKNSQNTSKLYDLIHKGQ